MFATVSRKRNCDAEVGLEPDVLEREARPGGDELDELWLVVERRVVDERGHRSAVPLDQWRSISLSTPWARSTVSPSSSTQPSRSSSR